MSSRPDLAYFEQILDYLLHTRGFDFTAYKKTSLMRRLVKRMQAVDVPTFEEYLDYLQLHQDEFAALFNTILINVTSFFRDEEVWAHLESDILPGLIAGRTPESPLRIWSAGCASGQEAYSIAMLVAERTGVEGLRDRVKIYATDVDEEALTEGRQAIYTARQVSDVPPALRDKYFDRSRTSYTVTRDLRRAVIFGRHDLIQDAPISRLDLLLCRNTLMYFQTEAQARVLTRFYFSLNPGGCLVVGRAEMLFSHGSIFTPIDLRRRVFRPVPRPHYRDRLLLLAQTGREVMTNNIPNHQRLREVAFEADSVPQIVLDQNGTLAAVNAPARARFGLSTDDVGRLLQDLEISYRPVELRGALQRVLEQRRPFIIEDVQWAVDGDVRYFNVNLAPLLDEDRSVLGTRISFVDATESKALQLQLQHSKQELDTAYEELRSTNEELETTNEELQSTVEELETTNEELQSTNEELETMNEELQSTNEELHTINDELRSRSGDLNTANAFMTAVFGSLQSAAIVLDRDFRVDVWTHRAEDLWGLRADEVAGGHFLNLDIGFPVGELRQPIRDVLAGATGHFEGSLSATNRRGKPIECRVTLTPLRLPDGSINGVILLMDEGRSGT